MGSGNWNKLHEASDPFLISVSWVLRNKWLSRRSSNDKNEKIMSVMGG
jgi:hypothetical protein